VSVPAPRRATYDDVLAAPENLVAELIDGTLYTQSRPRARHAHAASVIGMDLGSPFHRGRGGPGGWQILYEPELHLGADVVVPDIAGWRRERMPVIEDVAYFEMAPDWLCEVLSPKTALFDRRRKLPLYARFGVGHVWLVDPLVKTLELFRLDGETYRMQATYGGSERARIAPFEAIEFDLEALWGGAPDPVE
jgi:Uma2 family endonuclease